MSMMVQAVQQTIAIIKYTNIFLCCLLNRFETQGGVNDSWSFLYKLFLYESQ